MSEHTEQEDLEILAKSDLLVPDSLTMRELADHFMELWGEHLADTQAMDGVSDDEVAAATRQMGRVVDRLVNQETAVAGTVFTRTDVELMADWSAMDDIASLSTIGGLASVVNDYPAFDFSEAAAGEAPAADGRLRVFTVYHGNMRQDCTGGHVSWYFEDDGTMPESYLSRERAEEKFREWSGDLQGEFDREAACRGGRPTVMMACTGILVYDKQRIADIHTGGTLRRWTESDVTRQTLVVAVESRTYQFAFGIEHRAAGVSARIVRVHDEAYGHLAVGHGISSEILVQLLQFGRHHKLPIVGVFLFHCPL